MQEICCKRFTGEELSVKALQMVLKGKGRRGPTSVFVAFNGEVDGLLRGRVFHLHDGEIVERSEEIAVNTLIGYANFVGIAGAHADVVVSNWSDSCESVEKYQEFFPTVVKEVVGYAIRNFVTYRISGETPGAIIAFNYPGRATDYDADVLRGLAVVIGSVFTISDQMRETEKAFIYTIEALARACEAAEEDTGKHILRVNRYAGALAANMGLPADYVEVITYSAQMHDVGKIKVPAAILLKEGPLDERELGVIRMHPVYGEQILGDSPRLRIAREIALSHHENWDGSGYPNGLRGEDIPLSGRIVKLADVYDALRSRRSYKPPLCHAEAIGVFRDGDHRIDPRNHFDPNLLTIFFKIEHMFEHIYDSFAGENL
ncbi:HD-GYP domain-containing protein [Geobacter sp. AOG1]|uniref:HD-GYP domain-containing protein n=1 Tax=Geobacter sp. AOG1 TaxID=1566346 RepID=UPI001CC7FC1D|nr:HD domain-containing phosphohydrolase [Geobacter sp. AOG1]